MPSPLIQFRAMPPLDAKLAARANPWADDPQQRRLAEAARESLSRYYALLEAELRTVRLTRAQALALCDVLTGTNIDSTWAGSANRLLAYDIEDSIEDGLGERWDIDPTELAATVRGWTRGQSLAVVDAVVQFLALDTSDDHDVALAAVGLVRPDPAATRLTGEK